MRIVELDIIKACVFKAAFVLLPWLAATNATHAVDYHVDPAGGGRAYTTIQAALNAVHGQSAQNRANILISPGAYHEELEISKPYVSLIGLGETPDESAIVSGGQGIQGPGVYVKGQATGFMATNLTFENPLPDHVSQGLAIRSSADKSAFLNVRFLGYQDTVLVDNNSRQYFKNVFITGDTDFIFGNATAVFDHATIQNTDSGYITAASTEPTIANGLVFLDSTLVKGEARSGNPPTSAGTDEVYLGRPWQWDRGPIPSTIFVRTKMDDHIKVTGWNDWGSPTPDAVSRYSEFGSMDLDATPLPLGRTGMPLGRERWADPMTEVQADAYTLENLFGPVSFWNNHPELTPEGTGMTYLPQGDGQAWDPVAQLALLPISNALSGDFNGDGVVDAADYSVWRDNLGETEDGSVLSGNGNGGLVDATDYALWRSSFGNPALASSSATQAPEPTSILLVLSGSAAGLLGRRCAVPARHVRCVLDFGIRRNDWPDACCTTMTCTMNSRRMSEGSYED